MKKKLVSILLAVATVAGTCGAPAMAVFAEEGTETVAETEAVEDAEEETLRQLRMQMLKMQTARTLMRKMQTKRMTRTMFPMSIPPLLLKSIIPSWVSSTACTAKQKRRPTFPRDMP